MGAFQLQKGSQQGIRREFKMVSTGYAHFAEALVFAHGKQALGEAARHALLCERSGDTETAATWRKIQEEVKHQIANPSYQQLLRCA
jgi:hypothetical protein